MKKKCFLWIVKDSINKIKENPKKIVLAGVIDALFFFVYGFVTAPLLRKLVEYVVLIGTGISENANAMLRGETPTIGSIVANDPHLMQYAQNLLIIYVIVAIVIYIVYNFFHSITWKISSDITGRKIGIYDYMKEFALVNIFWFVAFIIYHILSLHADLQESAFRAMNAVPGNGFRIVITVLLFAIIYFAGISYALIGTVKKGKIKKSFEIGLGKVKSVLPAYVLILAVYFVIKYVLEAIGKYDTRVMFVVGLLTFIPAMTWARVYITSVVENAHS